MAPHLQQPWTRFQGPSSGVAIGNSADQYCDPAGGMPIVQGSGSTAAATVWHSVIANATYTGNAPFSLTYDAVGSGQVWWLSAHASMLHACSGMPADHNAA